MAQLRTVSWSYKQRGLVATVATATPNASALQVFLPNGPLALLPVKDGFSNIVWSTTPAQAAELEAMTPTDFVNAVNMVGTADLFCAAASCTPLLVIHVVVSRTYLRTKLPVYISHSSCLAAGCLVRRNRQVQNLCTLSTAACFDFLRPSACPTSSPQAD